LVARVESGITNPEFYEIWRVADPGHPEIDGLLIGDHHDEGFDWTEAKAAGNDGNVGSGVSVRYAETGHSLASRPFSRNQRLHLIDRRPIDPL
jgi:hypothetical protein